MVLEWDSDPGKKQKGVPRARAMLTWFELLTALFGVVTSSGSQECADWVNWVANCLEVADEGELVPDWDSIQLEKVGVLSEIC
jgi:hypothetical protein